MKFITVLNVLLSVASLASATEGGTIRGGMLTINSGVDENRDLGKTDCPQCILKEKFVIEKEKLEEALDLEEELKNLNQSPDDHNDHDDQDRKFLF